MKDKFKSKIQDANIGSKAKWTIIGGSIFEIILGLIMIIFPNASSSVIGYVVGAGFIIYGAFCVISFIIQPLVLLLGVSLFSGIVSIICGILIFSYPGTVLTILCIVLGLFIIVCGVMLSSMSVAMGAFGNPTWWISMVLSIAFVIAGFVILFNPGSSSHALMIFIGIVLLLEAAANFIAMYKVKKIKQEWNEGSSTTNGDAIDVDYVDVDD